MLSPCLAAGVFSGLASAQILFGEELHQQPSDVLADAIGFNGNVLNVPN